MTLLTLLQAFHREYGFSGDSPTSAESQSGETLRMVNWLVDAYKELQNEEVDWRWLRRTFTLATVASDDSYAYTNCTDVSASAVISRFKRWRFDDPIDPAKIYLTSSGNESWLTYTPWDWFKSVYKIGNQGTGRPAHITFDPQNNLLLGPVPNDVFTITGDFVRSAQALALNADTPEMPTDYHMLIVHRAARKYAYYESAQEVLSRANEEGGRIYHELRSDQLPEPRMAGPMA